MSIITIGFTFLNCESHRHIHLYDYSQIMLFSTYLQFFLKLFGIHNLITLLFLRLRLPSH